MFKAIKRLITKIFIIKIIKILFQMDFYITPAMRIAPSMEKIFQTITPKDS